MAGRHGLAPPAPARAHTPRCSLPRPLLPQLARVHEPPSSAPRRRYFVTLLASPSLSFSALVRLAIAVRLRFIVVPVVVLNT